MLIFLCGAPNRLKLSAAGQRLLKLANRVLPEVEATEEEFRSLLAGKSGRLHIAIECHACFEWLFPVLESFRKAWPDVDVDIRPGLAFDALPALAREEVDLVVSSDPEEHPDLEFSPLFDYEPVFVASSQHALAQKSLDLPQQDFRDESLDHLSCRSGSPGCFLAVADARQGRAARSASGGADRCDFAFGGLKSWRCGVARLGCARGSYNSDYVTRPLTERGVTRRLYAATRREDTTKPFMAYLLKLARSEPVKLQRS